MDDVSEDERFAAELRELIRDLTTEIERFECGFAASSNAEKLASLSRQIKLLSDLWIGRQLDKLPGLRKDWRFVATYIEEGGPISPDMRRFLASVLRGDEERPPIKTKSFATANRSADIAGFVLGQEMRGISRTKAIAAAAGDFGVTARHVQRALALFPTWPAGEREVIVMMMRLVKTYEALLADDKKSDLMSRH